MKLAEEAFEFKVDELVALIDPEMELPHETREKLVQVLQQDPRVTPTFAELEALAEDAGVADLVQGFTLNQMLDRLLEESAASPRELADALQHEPEDVPYDELLQIASARLARQPSAGRDRLLAIRQHLEQAHRSHQRVDAALKRFLGVLAELEPPTAERVLLRVQGLYARRLTAGSAADF